jgi:hypothetical protein
MDEQNWVRFYDAYDRVTHWHLEVERDEPQALFTSACGRTFHVYEDERYDQMSNAPADSEEACSRCLETQMASKS